MDRFVARTLRPPAELHGAQPTVVELFAGAGGMSLGLQQAGYAHVALVERTRHCVETLRRNGFKHVLHCDAHLVDYAVYRGADLVAGGPPCQPYSIGGVSHGAADPRDGWAVAVRAVREVQPRAFLFENVTGLMRTRFAGYIGGVVRELEDLGYKVRLCRANAADYGVPQRRRRVFFVGTRRGLRYHRPRKAPRVVTLREAIRDLGPPNGRNGHDAHTADARTYRGHVPSSLDAPCKCLTAGTKGNSGGAGLVILDDGTQRYLTIRELARVQSFPDTYVFCKVWYHAWNELGAACPPLLARRFAEGLPRPPPPSS